MFCIKCGRMIPDGMRFCPACGAEAVQRAMSPQQAGGAANTGAPGGYAQNGYQAPGGYAQNGYNAPGGYAQNGYNAPGGYAQNGYQAPNGYAQSGYQAPDGYALNGYPQNGYNAPNGYPQGYAAGNARRAASAGLSAAGRAAAGAGGRAMGYGAGFAAGAAAGAAVSGAAHRGKRAILIPALIALLAGLIALIWLIFLKPGKPEDTLEEMAEAMSNLDQEAYLACFDSQAGDLYNGMVGVAGDLIGFDGEAWSSLLNGLGGVMSGIGYAPKVTVRINSINYIDRKTCIADVTMITDMSSLGYGGGTSQEHMRYYMELKGRKWLINLTKTAMTSSTP